MAGLACKDRRRKYIRADGLPGNVFTGREIDAGSELEVMMISETLRHNSH